MLALLIHNFFFFFCGWYHPFHWSLNAVFKDLTLPKEKAIKLHLISIRILFIYLFIYFYDYRAYGIWNVSSVGVSCVFIDWLTFSDWPQLFVQNKGARAGQLT